MPATASFRTQIGTAQIWQRDPEYTDAELFCFRMSLGAQNFDAYRRTVASRRQMANGGYTEDHKGHRADLTAFAETHQRCQEIVDWLLRIYPEDAFYTRFSNIIEIDGEFIASGSRVLDNMRNDP